MFTNKEKGFFENMLLPGNWTEMTYTAKVHVLIFSK